MAIPSELLNKIKQFDENLEEHLSPSFNEESAKSQFIEPFFDLRVLGWDVHNTKGKPEAWRDVLHQQSIPRGPSRQAPDYIFRIGRTPVFVVEAKRPSIDLDKDIDSALQARSYAWTLGVPVLLTNFRQLAIYDAREPKPHDKVQSALIGRYLYKEYPEKWEEIFNTFSWSAVDSGKLDKFLQSKKIRGGRAMDEAFLKEIEKWRKILAENLASRNLKLNEEELRFAVQVTIDRIIFLRICEDRGMEGPRRLESVTNGLRIYPRLFRLFEEADDRYNSGLFHFREERGQTTPPDRITPRLEVDDEKLRLIIKGLYDRFYNFNLIPVEILGNIYERFLGNVIVLTEGHQARVREKPEVKKARKKAGGVFYTPSYIVEYIVEQTVGQLVKGKVPGQVAKLKILDPACGSGSFLLGAYQYLLDWHLDYYSTHDPLKHQRQIYPVLGGGYRLTTIEKKRILLNNIFGVDIDPQAVEVSKLSLLLKVLENETEETLRQLKLVYKERALPDLGNNIKCGNSLVGTDFEHNHQLNFLEEEERLRTNAFDWETGFPEVFKGEKSGFHAVIGNPPYVRQETLDERFKKYAAKHFAVFAGTADLYVYFIERSHWLLRKDGYFGMICSNKFIRANYGKAVRDFLSTQTTLRQIVDFGELPVFVGAATFPAIILTRNRKVKRQKFLYAAIRTLEFESLAKEVRKSALRLDHHSLEGDNWTLARKDELFIFNKMKQISIPLKKYLDTDIYFGIKTGYNEAFVIDRKVRDLLIRQDSKSAQFIKPFVVGDDVRKYRINYQDRFLILIPKGWTRKESGGTRDAWGWFQTKFPVLSKYLTPYASKAAKRYDRGDYWWELRECDYYEEFEKPKIIFPDIAKESRVAFDGDGLYLANTIYFIPTDDLYLLALLNSRLIFSYYKRVSAVLGDADKGGRLRWFRQDVLKIPIRPINFSNHTDQSRHDQIVKLVIKSMDLNKQLARKRLDYERTALQRQIAATDAEIDGLVYELYGLTEKEIKILEGG